MTGLLDSRPKDDHDAKLAKEWFTKLRVVNERDVKWRIEHILFEFELAHSMERSTRKILQSERKCSKKEC